MKSIDVFTVIGKNGYLLSGLLLGSMKSLSSSDIKINYNCIMSSRRTPPDGWNWVESVIKQKHTSLTHTTGLNRIYDYIQSDYTIVTDADIAVLTNNWDQKLIDEIEKRDVDILGVTHWGSHLGNFPIVTFFIARSASLLDARPDFRPNLEDYPNKWGVGTHLMKMSQERSKILGCAPGRLFQMDSGWQIPFAFLEKGYKGSVFKKIVNPNDILKHIPQAWRILHNPIVCHLGKSTKRRQGRVVKYVRAVRRYVKNMNKKSEINNAICRMKGCCSCCMFATIPPHSREEFANLSENVQMSLAQHWNNHKCNTPCAWLDQKTKLCHHYKNRPEICQKFIINGDDCKAFIYSNEIS